VYVPKYRMSITILQIQ